MLLCVAAPAIAFADESEDVILLPAIGWELFVSGAPAQQASVVAEPFSADTLNQLPSATSLATALHLGHGYQFGADASYASLDLPHADPSMAGRPAITAFSFDIAKDNVTGDHDTFAILFHKPLLAYQNSLTSSGFNSDPNRFSVQGRTRMGMILDGSETDAGFAYIRPLDKNTNLGFSLTRRNDADNISGVNDYAALFRFTASF